MTLTILICFYMAPSLNQFLAKKRSRTQRRRPMRDRPMSGRSERPHQEHKTTSVYTRRQRRRIVPTSLSKFQRSSWDVAPTRILFEVTAHVAVGLSPYIHYLHCEAIFLIDSRQSRVSVAKEPFSVPEIDLKFHSNKPVRYWLGS
jgi:hypothetical protein